MLFDKTDALVKADGAPNPIILNENTAQNFLSVCVSFMPALYMTSTQNQ